MRNRLVTRVKQFDSIMELMKGGFKVTLPNGNMVHKINSMYVISKTGGDNDLNQITENDLNTLMSSFVFWELKNGDLVEVNNMTTKHILNTMEFIKNRLQNPTISSTLRDYFTEFLQIFTVLMRDRNIDVLTHDETDIGLDI